MLKRIIFSLIIATNFLLLAGCASSGIQAVQFDLGALNEIRPLTMTLPPVYLASVESARDLDSTDMRYRLDYENPQQVRSYATNRWSMTPAELIDQRLRQIFFRSGVALSNHQRGQGNLTLMIRLDDFSQHFRSNKVSKVRLAFQATILIRQEVLAQTLFEVSLSADPNAAGQAKGLAQASEVIGKKLLQWMGQVQLNKSAS